MPNLTQNWIRYERQSGTLAAAIRRMSAALGREIRSCRVYDWSTGKYRPPPDAARYMRSRLMPQALAREGAELADEAYARVLDEIDPA